MRRGLAALVAFAALPGPAFALIGDTPAVRAAAFGRTSAMDPRNEVLALLATDAGGQPLLVVRTTDRATGFSVGQDDALQLVGSMPTALIVSQVARPGALLVLREDLTIAEFALATDAAGSVKLIGTTPTVHGPFASPAAVGTGMALAEAPNAADPAHPYLAIGTSGGSVVIVHDESAVAFDLGQGPVRDLGAVPQVGVFAFVALTGLPGASGILTGLHPDCDPETPGLQPATLFSLADPRPHPFVDFATFGLGAGQDPPAAPVAVRFVAANGTNEVAVLSIPADPAAATELATEAVGDAGVTVGQVALGSLGLVPRDGSAILYDPGFSPAGGFGQTVFTAFGASLTLSPGTLNLAGRGQWVTAVVEVADGGAAAIDASTLKLAAGSIEVPVASGFTPQIGDEDRDGNPDLLAKFDRALVAGMLMPFLDRGGALVRATWRFTDGSSGRASAWVRLVSQPEATESGGAQASARSVRHLFNPITQKPYSPEELRRLQLLRRRFPDNPLVPRALSAQEEEEERRRAAERKDIGRRMTAGTATLDEIERYYGDQERLVGARLQLVDFVLAEAGWSDAIRERYRRVRAAAERQLQRLADRRQRSLDLFERRRTKGDPPPPLAAIQPRVAVVTQGETAHFEAQPVGGAEVVALTWSGPFASGRAATFDVATKSLEPGLHDVFLEAVDAAGRTSLDQAHLEVRAAPPPAVDLAVESIELADLTERTEGQVVLHALAGNLGVEPVGDVTVSFQIDAQEVHRIEGLSLQQRERRAIPTPLLPADEVYGHDVIVRISAAKPVDEPDLDNNQKTARFTQPPPLVLDPSPGIAPETPLPPPPLTLNPASALFAAAGQTAPLPIDLGPVDGFADLHIHQMAKLGFDGRFLWGAYDGSSEANDLGQCNGTNHAVCWLPGPIAELFKQWEMGSHAGLLSSINVPIIFGGTFYCQDPNWVGGPGRITKGWHEDTATDSFKHWPVWQTVTHQQVYGPWLEAAHEQGLNLIVMSAVSAAELCGLMPASQGYGGLHPLDDVILEGTGNLALDRDIAGASACNDMKNVRRQLVAAWQFDEAHDWYEIALTPGHAAQIIQEGRLAVVLSLEASRFLDNPDTEAEMTERLDYFVDDLGVRSVQPLHELNNTLGGASYWSTLFDVIQALDQAIAVTEAIVSGDQTASAGAYFDALQGMERDATGDNVVGLTTLGLQFVTAAMDRNLLIDVAHMSRNASNVAYGAAVARDHYPLFVSHVRYSDLLTGSTFNDHLAKHWETIQQVKSVGGMAGVRTARNRVRAYQPAGLSAAWVTNNCPGSDREFAQSYLLGSIGYGLPQAFASDMNGFIEQMRPRFKQSSHPKYGDAPWACNEGSPGDVGSLRAAQGSRSTNGTGADFDLTGFGRINQVGDLLADLSQNLDVETAELEGSAQPFVDMWQRAHLGIFRAPGSSCLDRSGIVGGAATGGPLTPGCSAP